MCNKAKDKILWLKVTEETAKKMFMAAARVKNPEISVIQWIPPQVMKRKKALNEISKDYRKRDETLWTQI